MLVLRDARTLGTISAVKEASVFEDKLGWEPLLDSFPVAAVREKLHARKMAIKPVLLDQKLWAGIGNIYASEILWEAQISPLKSAASLTRREIERMVAAVPMVLRRAVEKGGSTIRDFMGPEGEAGAYQKQFRVYDRAGLDCLRCGGEIVRVVQAQRSTYYCRKCQQKR
jgi:formamidopyrimidine-DNA glycosylase